MPLTIRKRVHEIFATTFRLQPAEILDTNTPEEIRGWDSLGHLRLIGAIEEGFGLTLSDTEVMDMDSVGHIVEILVARGATP